MKMETKFPMFPNIYALFADMSVPLAKGKKPVWNATNMPLQ